MGKCYIFHEGTTGEAYVFTGDGGLGKTDFPGLWLEGPVPCTSSDDCPKGDKSGFKTRLVDDKGNVLYSHNVSPPLLRPLIDQWATLAAASGLPAQNEAASAGAVAARYVSPFQYLSSLSVVVTEKNAAVVARILREEATPGDEVSVHVGDHRTVVSVASWNNQRIAVKLAAHSIHSAPATHELKEAPRHVQALVDELTAAGIAVLPPIVDPKPAK